MFYKEKKNSFFFKICIIYCLKIFIIHYITNSDQISKLIKTTEIIYLIENNFKIKLKNNRNILIM